MGDSLCSYWTEDTPTWAQREQWLQAPLCTSCGGILWWFCSRKAIRHSSPQGWAKEEPPGNVQLSGFLTKAVTLWLLADIIYFLWVKIRQSWSVKQRSHDDNHSLPSEVLSINFNHLNLYFKITLAVSPWICGFPFYLANLQLSKRCFIFLFHLLFVF